MNAVPYLYLFGSILFAAGSIITIWHQSGR